LSVAIGLSGGQHSPYVGFGYVSMIIPAIAVLIVTLALRDPPRIDWGWLPAEYVPIALLLIPLVLHASMLSFVWIADGTLPWQDWLTRQPDGLFHTPPDRGWGAVTAAGLAAHIIANAIVGVIVVSVLALFEEIGWRAWLLPRLAERIGVRRAIVATSAIWGLWHIPFALSGIQHIDGVSPLALAAGVPIGVAITGLIIGWLYVRTESIWIAALAHGALNNWGQYAFKYMNEPVHASAGATLAVGMTALLVAAMVLLRRRP
jgi:membrane protease YdiL (CAAX protease family)